MIWRHWWLMNLIRALSSESKSDGGALFISLQFDGDPGGGQVHNRQLTAFFANVDRSVITLHRRNIRHKPVRHALVAEATDQRGDLQEQSFKFTCVGLPH